MTMASLCEKLLSFVGLFCKKRSETILTIIPSYMIRPRLLSAGPCLRLFSFCIHAEMETIINVKTLGTIIFASIYIINL